MQSAVVAPIIKKKYLQRKSVDFLVLLAPKNVIALNKHFTRVFQCGTHFTAESTEAMRIKCLAQGHNILMQSEFEPSIAVFRNRHLTRMTNTP